LLQEFMADRDLVNVVKLVEQLQPALERGDRTRLNEIIRQLVDMRAPMGGQWQQLAFLAAGNGELTLARTAIDLLVEASGVGPAAQFQKVSFLALLGLWHEADALLRTLPADVPHPISNAYSRGSAALNLGKPDEARGHFDRLTQMAPQSGFGWFSLALTTDMSREPQMAERLIAAERDMASVPVPERAPYHYALGKTHADRGDRTLAFAAFSRGAALMKSTVRYDREGDRAEAARAIEGYSADRIAAIADQQDEPTGRTIFVAGLPRSGTTLLEQILTSHSTISDGGETSRLFLLAGDVGGASWPAVARYVEANGAASAAHLWNHWLDELFPGSARIVDKTVTTSRFLGLAATLLPEAPLIWITRDPLDRAWSCFRINFSSGAMPWSNDLRDIAAHFRIEDALMSEWQQILGDRLLTVSYEALVTDPETWIRRIATHCGLTEEAGMFAPHENRRAVTTASLVQVRRPINREGIGAAEPYREFLQPFIDAYYS
jgi:tetratricopeptide (TPR) repeat protein